MMLNPRPSDRKDLSMLWWWVLILVLPLLCLCIYKSYVTCKVLMVNRKDSNCWTLDLHTLKVKGCALGWCALMTGNVWADDQDFSRPGSTPPCRPWSVLSSQWNLVVFCCQQGWWLLLVFRPCWCGSPFFFTWRALHHSFGHNKVGGKYHDGVASGYYPVILPSNDVDVPVAKLYTQSLQPVSVWKRKYLHREETHSTLYQHLDTYLDLAQIKNSLHRNTKLAKTWNRTKKYFLERLELEKQVWAYAFHDR